jgi:NAD(P)-dependent dehydrogenase (short-subunit alcohol dehydrogenase family)
MKKVVVITGGSDGVGKATAKLLSPNHDVFILSPSPDKLKEAAKETGSKYQVCDARNFVSCQSAVEAILREAGGIDCLFNNAGKWLLGPLEDNPQETLEDLLAVNVLGVINMTKAVIPAMKTKGEGLIVNMSSQAGLSAKADRTVYNTTKWAVAGFTKSIQLELAPFGIRVTGLYPGLVATDMFRKAGISKAVEGGLEPSDIARTIEFLLDLRSDVVIPELGIKHISG